jgi:hypothetical protein
MWCRIVCAAVILSLAATVAAAQDPTKVEPKHYKLHFENERVQVVDVHYGPHEKSEMHDHPAGVSVSVTGGHLRFTDANGKVTEVYAKAAKPGGSPPTRTKWRTWATKLTTGFTSASKVSWPRPHPSQNKIPRQAPGRWRLFFPPTLKPLRNPETSQWDFTCEHPPRALPTISWARPFAKIPYYLLSSASPGCGNTPTTIPEA